VPVGASRGCTGCLRRGSGEGEAAVRMDSRLAGGFADGRAFGSVQGVWGRAGGVGAHQRVGAVRGCVQASASGLSLAEPG